MQILLCSEPQVMSKNVMISLDSYENIALPVSCEENGTTSLGCFSLLLLNLHALSGPRPTAIDHCQGCKDFPRQPSFLSSRFKPFHLGVPQLRTRFIVFTDILCPSSQLSHLKDQSYYSLIFQATNWIEANFSSSFLPQPITNKVQSVLALTYVLYLIATSFFLAIGIFILDYFKNLLSGLHLLQEIHQTI